VINYLCKNLNENENLYSNLICIQYFLIGILIDPILVDRVRLDIPESWITRLILRSLFTCFPYLQVESKVCMDDGIRQISTNSVDVRRSWPLQNWDHTFYAGRGFFWWGEFQYVPFAFANLYTVSGHVFATGPTCRRFQERECWNEESENVENVCYGSTKYLTCLFNFVIC